jgi:hypothetical protein
VAKDQHKPSFKKKDILRMTTEIFDHQLKVIFKGKRAIEANPVFSKINHR